MAEILFSAVFSCKNLSGKHGHNYHSLSDVIYVILRVNLDIVYLQDNKRVIMMKIVYASTPEQEMEIKRLTAKFYRDIFPLYFSDEEIRSFKEAKVLNFPEMQFNYHGTLKEAYSVIASLQTLISILETANPGPKYEWAFYLNAQTLNEYGIHFPFRYNQFTGAKSVKGDFISIYAKAANELLI